MATPAHTTQTWRFGLFEVDAQLGELRRAGVPIKLREQCFRILVLLLEHDGQLVTREDLRGALWSTDTFVDFDHSLNAAVMKLREVLGDTAEKPLYIETIPKRGYRFVAPLASTEDIQKKISIAHEQSPYLKTSYAKESLRAHLLKRLRINRAILLGAVIVLACIAAMSWYLLRPLPLPRVTDYQQLTYAGQVKWPVGTDGARLYFDQWLGPDGYGQVSITGGDVSWVSTALTNTYLYEISPDSSSLLFSSHRDRVYSLWSYHMVARSLRHLADSTVASAAWSPDGARIAYATAYGEILVMQSDGSSSRTVVPAASDLAAMDTRGLTWSPDSNRLRFHRNSRIWEVSSDGKGLHALLPHWQPSWSQSWGRWTPEGDFFIFVAGLKDAQLWAIDERRGPAVRSHSEPFQLTFGPINWDHPVISREGRKIFARGYIHRGELVRYDARSGRLEPFLRGISADWVTFSPDGRFVAYTSFPDGILWRANRDGSDPVRLTDPPSYPVGLRWSPDGSKILFIDGKQDHRVAYTISPQGGAAQPVMTRAAEEMSDPNWSPDGKKIVFSQMAFGGPSFTRNASADIRILDLDSQEIQVLPGSAGLASPRWSPDGRFIAALGNGSLQMFDFRTQRWWTAGRGTCNFPTFSRNGQYVYFLLLYGNPGVFRVPISGGNQERVVDLTGFRHTGSVTFWMGLDAKDAPILLRESGTDEIYALTLERK